MRIQSAQQKYLNENFGLQDDIDLAGVRDELNRQNLDFMSISSYEARLLQFLIRLIGARQVVEVGTLFGYSALAMAKAGAEVITLEKNPVNHGVATRLFAQATVKPGRVRALCGDAMGLLKEIEGEGPFDMVFIDADKAAYPRYLDWAESHVRRGGLIVGDNTFLWGGVYGEPTEPDLTERAIQAMREFNLRLSDRTRFNSTLISTVEGLTVAQKL